jgi:hypothetical protein
MKWKIIGLVVFMVSATGIYYGVISNRKTSPELFFFDGPDKAMIHNFYMIQDRQARRIPYERLLEARRLELAARMNDEERNFNWKNWDTNIPGRARMMYYQASSGVLFSGAVTGGLWKNADYKNGAAWELVNEFGGASINCLAVDSNNSNVLYVGTGESFTAIINYRESTGLGNGIYKSTDGGLNWSRIASTANFYFVNDMVVRNEDGVSVLYAAVGSGTYQGGQFIQEGLYRSSNQGETWQQVLPNVTGTSHGYCVSDLELTGDNRLYAGTMRNIYNEGGGIILYSDDGLNWDGYSDFSQFTKDIGWSAGRTIVKAAPTNPDHIYALFTMGYTNALGQLRDYQVFLKQSADGGSFWQNMVLPNSWANIPWHALSLAVDPVNEDKILIGALDTYVLNDASNPSITVLDWIRLSDWAAMYDLYDPNLTQEEKDVISQRYVHADIHDIQFVGDNPDEVLMTTDGGVFFSENMGVTININPENPIQEFPVFQHINNAQNTTQFYYGRIHPQKGKQEALGGAQDNGSIYVNNNLGEQFESMISGGDGGYCFWDSNNSNVKITSVYGNRYYIHVNNQVHFGGPINGLFVNPVDYDDVSNLLYSNTATSTFGGLYPGLKGRHYDTLEIFNVNSYIGTPTLGLPVVSFVKLNAGIKEAITAIKLSRHSVSNNKTAFIATENGKVYKVRGLPSAVTTQRIDNNKLPNGYISSIDIGRNENVIMVTLSNFGVASVWLTRDGGATWVNLERNLPDMPVRWGVFNPYDDYKMMLATEMGIWGLENTLDEEEQWKSYNLGFPEIRVDMIDIRKEDSTVLAATHGHGFWVGKFNQGPPVVTDVTEEIAGKDGPWLYPNPASRYVMVSPDVNVQWVIIHDSSGKIIGSVAVNDKIIDLSTLNNGVYFVEGRDWLGKKISKQKIIVNAGLSRQ